MLMDLLKWLPLDEKYRHPAMERLVALFGFHGGFMYGMCKVIYAQCNACIVYCMHIVCADNSHKIYTTYK